MYELSRVRLFSVGPPGARYQDVCLDLRGVGEPVSAAPQSDLFEDEDVDASGSDRVPRRPSPASVLFLENGGGKSVLLKLVFSVLLPGRRQVVGTTNTRVLEKFVLAEDVGHVVLEWMHTVTGERLITGKVSEWRGHVVSNDPAKLLDAWYSFVPAQEFRLDDLPFTQDRRRVTLSGYRTRLEEARDRLPTLDLVWETVHRDWSAHLVRLGLDPELFRYQRAMNAGEGEAAEAFAFPTDEAFVDFLLRAVLDPEEPRGLADVVAGYAAKIAERGELALERDFVEGLLERLSPLVEAEREAAGARAAEEAALGAVAGLAGGIAARHRLETRRLADAGASVAETAEAERATGAAERRLYDTSVELRRRVALLRCQAAQQRHDELLERNEEATELVAAWNAVEPVLRDQLASAEASRLRRVVNAERDRAQPVLQARQEAAAALASALRTAADEADRTARAEAAEAAEAAKRAEQVRAEELRQAGQAAEHRAASDQARATLGRIRDQVQEAVRAGWLGEHEDAAEAAERAERAERGAAEAVGRSIAEHAALRAARRAADQGLGAARLVEASELAARDSARARLREAELRRDELAGEPRLAELLGVDSVQLGPDGDALLERLAAALESADERRAELRAEQHDDARSIQALGDGGLLPVPAEVEQAAAALEKAGIVAHPGWRQLARLPEAERDAAIERVPHLIAGLLLADPADAERARDVLVTARLLPRAVIAVGDVDSVRTAPGVGVSFVVPPNPAMFDEQTADRVRVRLTEATARRREQLAELDAQLHADRELLDRLRRWLASYPPAQLDELTDAAESAEHALATARHGCAAAAEEVAVLDARSEALDAELPTLRETEQTSRDRAGQLHSLRLEAERRPELTELARREDAAAEAAEARSAQAKQAAAQARLDEQEHLRAQDRASAASATVRGELAELPTDGDDPGRRVEQPLSVLRAEYRRAESAYAAAEVDADLRASLAAAERAEEAARSALLVLPERARARAGELLRGADGTDAASRGAASEQADRALRETQARLQAAHTELAMATRARDEFNPRPGGIEPYESPRDIEHGERLIEQVHRDHADAEAAVASARRHQAVAAERERAVQLSVDGFARLLQAFSDSAAVASADQDEQAEQAEPFDGDVDAAMTRWTALRASVRAAEERSQREDAGVRKAADEVALHAQEARFGSVTSPVRRHVLGVSRAQMPGLATDWQRALRPRLRSLEDDLANIGRHRSGIVTRLHGMVGEALRTLRLAQRLSQLPDGLSDWSGQQFLRIRFDEVEDPDDLADLLGEVVDRTAEGYQNGGKDQRDGMSLLLRGVRAAMPKGVRVEILKPDAVLRAERLRVSEIRDVFSGGQQLTAAIVLYCTMAALRANQRGEGRRPHAGVLFLDNPIGRASASYLLELQFGVAEALGVQLIYTTGLFDAGALSAFPLLIRLRNDADLRAGRKYLTVDDHMARQLGRLPSEDGSGQLTAARLFRRPAPAAR
jgi:hypothetical protein